MWVYENSLYYRHIFSVNLKFLKSKVYLKKCFMRHGDDMKFEVHCPGIKSCWNMPPSFVFVLSVAALNGRVEQL